jgi:hypothetical protein
MKLAGAAWIFALLIWIPFEDTTTLPATAFALTGVAWLAWHSPPTLAMPLWRAIVFGAGLGLAVPLGALLLMAFKSGLHGHGFPDYTPTQVWSIIQTTPIWVLIGVLVGAFTAFFARRLDRRL